MGGTGFAVPMVKFESGQCISQTIAILSALGEQFKLDGTTTEEKLTCLQTLLDFNDVVTELKFGKLKEDPERYTKWLGVLEGKLKSKFFVRDEPTVADFMGFFVLTFTSAKIGAFDVEKFPKVAQWMSDIAEVPCVKKMKEGSVPLTPPFLHKR